MPSNKELEKQLKELQKRVARNEKETEGDVKRGKRPILTWRIALELLIAVVAVSIAYGQFRISNDQHDISKEQNRIAEIQSGFNEFQIIQNLYQVGKADTAAIDDLFSYLIELDTITQRKFVERKLDRLSYDYLSKISYDYYFQNLRPKSAHYFLSHAKSFVDVWHRTLLLSNSLDAKVLLERLTDWYDLEHTPYSFSLSDHLFLDTNQHHLIVKKLLHYLYYGMNRVYTSSNQTRENLHILTEGSFDMLRNIDFMIDVIVRTSFFEPKSMEKYVDLGGFRRLGSRVLFDLEDPYRTNTYKNRRSPTNYLILVTSMRYDIYLTYLRKNASETEYANHLPFLIELLNFERKYRKSTLDKATDFDFNDSRSYQSTLRHWIIDGYDSLRQIYEQSNSSL